MSDTTQYKIKSIGVGLAENTKETLIIKGDDGKRDEYEVGAEVTLTPEQKKHLNELGVKFTSAGDGESEDDDNETEAETEPDAPDPTNFP